MRQSNLMQIHLEDVAALLNKHTHFVITAHVNPDGDAIGSVLALYYGLISIGKKVTCLIDDDLPENFRFLAGYEKIEKPSKKILEADLLVVLDTSDLDRVGQVKNLTNAPVLNIDHHVSNNKFADYLYLDSQRAATGEIIFQLFHLMKIKFDEVIATSLYMAIATDCGFFRYANTTVFTMQCAAELMGCGARPNLISEELEKKPLPTIKALSKVLDSLEVYGNGKISCLCVSAETLAICGSTEGFIEFARIVDGVELAVLLKYVDDACCRVSMRSKAIDVSMIAVAFGGGGHKRAAGCTIHQPIAETKQLIITELQKVMGDLKYV